MDASLAQSMFRSMWLGFSSGLFRIRLTVSAIRAARSTVSSFGDRAAHSQKVCDRLIQPFGLPRDDLSQLSLVRISSRSDCSRLKDR